MNSKEIANQAMHYLNALSDKFGTGNLAYDIVALMIIIACIMLAITIVYVFRGSSHEPPPMFDRTTHLMGRMDRVEKSVDELKVETKQIKDRLDSGPPVGVGDSGVVDYAPPEKLEPVLSEPPQPETLSRRLVKTRLGLFDRLKSIFAGKPSIDESMLAEAEALLVGSDLGIKTVSSLIADTKAELARGQVLNEQDFISRLKLKVLSILERDVTKDTAISPQRRADGPLVVLMVGVNGVGKTTTVAKLADKWHKSGANVLLVAADTFRAAAVEQLMEWGRRIGVPVVSGEPEAKPGTVVFDAMVRAQKEAVDVLIIDTAGRLHTKSNLMQELEGVRNIIERHQPGAPHETILVVDGSTGQNAISQARDFHEAISLSGLIVTKLDGTPKGGVVVAIKNDLGIPVRYIGVGEGPEDLRPFVAAEFVEALFDASELNGGEEKVSAHGETRRRRRKDTQ